MIRTAIEKNSVTIIFIAIVFAAAFIPAALPDARWRLASAADQTPPAENEYVTVRFSETGAASVETANNKIPEREIRAAEILARAIAPFAKPGSEASFIISPSADAPADAGTGYSPIGLFSTLAVSGNGSSAGAGIDLPPGAGFEKFDVSAAGAASKNLAGKAVVARFIPKSNPWPFPPNDKIAVAIDGNGKPESFHFPGPCPPGAAGMKNPGTGAGTLEYIEKTGEFWSSAALPFAKFARPGSEITIMVLRSGRIFKTGLPAVILENGKAAAINMAARYGNIDWAAETKKTAEQLKPVFDAGYKAAFAFTLDEGGNRKAADRKKSEEWLKKGLESISAGKLDEAVEFCDNALESDPKNFRAWRAKARALDRWTASTNALAAP